MCEGHLPLAIGKTYTPQLVGVPAETIPFMWEMLEPKLREAWEAVDHENVPVEHMYAQLLDRILQAWLIVDGKRLMGVGTTRIDNSGDDRVCWIYTLQCKHFFRYREALEEQLFAWAKNYDCNKFWLTGREGWERSMPDWHHIVVNGIDIMEKRL